ENPAQLTRCGPALVSAGLGRPTRWPLCCWTWPWASCCCPGSTGEAASGIWPTPSFLWLTTWPRSSSTCCSG
ncbi:PIGQ isoform 17, partial [Pan troglodytes]